MTVKQLLNNLDSSEITEWLAYYKMKNEAKPESEAPLDASLKNELSGFSNNTIQVK